MSLQALAYCRLRRDILSGAISPQERLSHRKLAARFGVGLHPVREAMLRLDAEGILIHRPQSGVYVRKLTVEEIQHLYDLRELIEPYAAARAARLADREHVRRLARICRRIDAMSECFAGREAESWPQGLAVRASALDLEFHQTILDASRNRAAAAMFARVGVLPTVFLRNAADNSPERSRDIERARVEHLAIFTAIRAGDEEGARRHMHTHLLNARPIYSELSESVPIQDSEGSSHV